MTSSFSACWYRASPRLTRLRSQVQVDGRHRWRQNVSPSGADAPAIGVPRQFLLERGCFLALPVLDTAQDTLGVSPQVCPVDVAVGTQIRQFGLRSPPLAVGLRRRRAIERGNRRITGPGMSVFQDHVRVLLGLSHDVIAAQPGLLGYPAAVSLGVGHVPVGGDLRGRQYSHRVYVRV